MSENHQQIYSKAHYYDVAFSFKNVPEENQTLLNTYRRLVGREASSFLDIAAGPATNAIDMAKRGLKSFAMDYSPEMVAYGRSKAREAGVALDFFQGDMRKFEMPAKVDLAAIFMDSTSYLITNDDVLSHFGSVSKCLNEGGLYFLEMSHPRDVFNAGKSSQMEWDMKSGDIEVNIKWGSETDIFDPIRQTTRVTSTLSFISPQETGDLTETAEQRYFTFTEIDALVRLSSCFKMLTVLGSLKPGVSFSNEKECWRMVPVLQKIQ